MTALDHSRVPEMSLEDVPAGEARITDVVFLRGAWRTLIGIGVHGAGATLVTDTNEAWTIPRGELLSRIKKSTRCNR